MTCRKGCNKEGVSNSWISAFRLTYYSRRYAFSLPLQPFNSRRRRANPAIRALSCILFPFFPRRPHLLASSSSSIPSTNPAPFLDFLRALRSSRGVEGREPCKLELGAELPPKIVETDECAHRACFRMAAVTVMHSVVTRATGSTATETGTFWGFMVKPFVGGASRSGLLVFVVEYIEEVSLSGLGVVEETTIGPGSIETAVGVSSLIVH